MHGENYTSWRHSVATVKFRTSQNPKMAMIRLPGTNGSTSSPLVSFIFFSTMEAPASPNPICARCKYKSPHGTSIGWLNTSHCTAQVLGGLWYNPSSEEICISLLHKCSAVQLSGTEWYKLMAFYTLTCSMKLSLINALTISLVSPVVWSMPSLCSTCGGFALQKMQNLMMFRACAKLASLVIGLLLMLRNKTSRV
jgi:hypothetical protein